MKKFLLTCIAVACSLVAVAEELLIEAESFKIVLVGEYRYII